MTAAPAAPAADEFGIERPKLRRLYRDWSERRHGRLMPSRKDFDILDLGYLLGDLNLLDVLYEPLRFRFRVHGSNAVARLGFDLTGKTIDGYPDPDYRRIVREHFTAAVRSKAPQRIVRDPYRIKDRVLRWEGLILPLSTDGSTVNMLLVGLSVE